jgi:adenylate kinase
LLRAEVKSQSEVGVMCATLMKEGKLVPNELTLTLIKNAMKKAANKNFLIDGFPRSLDQATSFAAAIQEPDFVLFFDCPLETMTERLLERGLSSGRSDDNAETIKKRFDTFTSQSLPVVDFYKEKGAVHVISSVPTPNTVYNEVIGTMVKNGLKPKPVADKVVFVLGGPGSGKGTQCAKLVEDFGFTHLSAGDLLRDEVKSQSEVGQMCGNLMKEGKLVPMQVTIGLLKAAMEKAENKTFLIDGFPRALDQGRAFTDYVQEPDFVLFFDCPLETMTERLMERGLTSGRSDDNMDSIRKRFDTFTSQSLPVLDAYQEKGNAHVVSSVPAPNEVYDEVISVMAKNGVKPKPVADKVVFVLGGPGSGKGTQCAKLVKDFGFTHLSAGDLLRDEVKSRSEVGHMCANLMKEGKLVPMEVTIGLLKAAMEKATLNNFLIDGFPRALDQAKAFETRVQAADFVLFFDCTLETMTERLLERGKTSGRSDDNMGSIRKRFDTFTNQSLPVLDHYKVQGNAHVVSSVAAPDAVYAQVRAVGLCTLESS